MLRFVCVRACARLRVSVCTCVYVCVSIKLPKHSLVTTNPGIPEIFSPIIKVSSSYSLFSLLSGAVFTLALISRRSDSTIMELKPFAAM